MISAEVTHSTFSLFLLLTIEIAALNLSLVNIQECGCELFLEKHKREHRVLTYCFFARGFVYCRNEELEPGWVAFGNGKLLHRPVSFDNKPHSLFQVVDQHTLQVKERVIADLQ